MPDLGFGIKPFLPKCLPNLAILGIISGVAIATSKSSQPSSIFFVIEASIKYSAPASSAFFPISPSTNNNIFTVLPVPLGRSEVCLIC